MFVQDKEPRYQPSSNSSNEGDQKCEKIEACKDARRFDSSKKPAPSHDLVQKSFKTTRKKEGGACGLFFESYLMSQNFDDEVPSNASYRFASRRDENKTDSARVCGEDHGRVPLEGIACPREPVVVRETKASRLRAASRIPSSDVGPPSIKSFKDVKAIEKNQVRTFISRSPNFYSLNKKNIDKSHTRKSHLNRSHTSEGVYDDACAPGGSNIRRRRPKNISSESSPSKPSAEKSSFSFITMGNSNGTIKDPRTSILQLPKTSPMTKSPLTSSRRSTGFIEKCSSKPSLGKNVTADEDSLKPEHRFDRTKQVDIATRAEILAASTLKMISRLDEINCKSRTLTDSYKKSLPQNSVIHREHPNNLKTEGKKISLFEEATGETLSNQNFLKAEKLSPKKSPEGKKPEVKPSILKCKPSGTFSAGGDSQKPVSILKRKSLSQDDAQTCSPPVTFSPSVFKKETDVKKQGILKKRRSLDENEVMRRRSYSPEAPYDFKSILKTQRRSSLEELTRRSHSPDSTPQGILKRKTSKEEDIEDEPQGILKRKSLPCLDFHQHAKVFESVTSGADDASGNVRPILKKKSSSEEHSTCEPPPTEGPKSILKKKPSLEVDEPEEKPMKPILKSSKVSSVEEPKERKPSRSLIFSAFDEPKPILKREMNRSAEDEENVVILRSAVSRRERPYSSSDIDSELSAIFLKRRSLEFQPISAINFDLELQRTKRASSNDRLRGNLFRRPVSVAEKINNLENFLKLERAERERRNSPPGTPPSNFMERNKLENQEEIAAPPMMTLKSTVGHTAIGSHCLQERRAILCSRTSSSKETQDGVTSIDTVSLRLASLKSPDSDGPALSFCSDVNSHSSFKFKKPPSDPEDRILEDSKKGLVFRKTSFQSSDPERVGDPLGEFENKNDTDCCYSIDSCGEKISNLSLKEVSAESSGKFMDSQDFYLLQKSRSVSADTSMLKDIEKQEANIEIEKIMKEHPENTDNNHCPKEKSDCNSENFGIQTSFAEKIDVDLHESKSKVEDHGGGGGENHEDELCTMSYKDRLRLFESTFTPKFPEPTPKKRGGRYRTQPVTTDEVETAKNRRSSFSLENFPVKKADEHSSGLKNLKENSCNLSNRLIKSKPTENKIECKGISKIINLINESKTSDSDSDSPTTEKKGILKTEYNGNNGSLKGTTRKADKEAASELKGILKQPCFKKKASSSSGEESGKDECVTSFTPRSPQSNLASILQRVELVGRSSRQNISHRDESKASPKFLPNPRVLSHTKNASSLMKSQSHSSVTSEFESPLKSSFPDGISLPGGLSCAKMKSDREQGRKEKNTADSQRMSKKNEASLFHGELRRSKTGSLRPSDEDTDDDLSGASIHERLARLKKSGEQDWQKRKSHVINLENELSVIATGNYLYNDHCLSAIGNQPLESQLIQENEDFSTCSSILADRLGKLDVAKQGWKKRVKPSDAARFSVEGKILGQRDSSSPPDVQDIQTSPARTPLVERKKRSPKPFKFRSKQCNLSLNSVPSSPLEIIDNPISRSVSAPGNGKDGLFSLPVSEVLKEVKGPVIVVPKNDDETFTSFFNGLNNKQALQERLELRDEDLDAVTKMNSSQLLVQKRTIKTQKRRVTVKNPVKSLASRLDLQEYTEIKTGIAEKELKRMKLEKATKNSNLAIEALAGLASQEDFTAVNLRKATELGFSSRDAPYKDKMLLQVKGRRHVQTRLIEPVAKNINTGDCFILVTSKEVFLYVGEFSNVIEKSRGAEIALYIQQKGDLGCTTNSVITIGEGCKASRDQVTEFWRLLGGEPGCEKVPGNLDEDELFESAIVDTNMIYEVSNNELIPVEAYWGSIPKIDLLDPNKILVFDFGSEFYVWNGKNVNVSKRKAALEIARELWEEGFDYTDCDLCPLTSASYLGGQTPWCEIPDFDKAGPVRPGWALFAKLTQNMETVLFREKFSDWPDYAKDFRRGKNSDGEQIFSSGALNFKPCDAKKMLENILPETNLVLEGNNLGRGLKFFDEETRKCLKITTQNVTVWHVNEYEYSEVPTSSLGHFHTEDNYVVRWHYFITTTGRELSGQPSKHVTTGRNRYAYFFWQGHDSPVNDKGAAACLTVELDKEHGPQVRVVQGFEPPAFLNLFKGGMVVHKGRRCSQVPREKLRLFICRGAMESESALFEVSCSMRQLRSLASFVLVNRDTGKIYVWHGRKSPENSRTIALKAAKRVRLEASEFDFQAKEINIREELEGSESEEFIRSLGGDNRQLYYSLKNETELKTPRLFHLTSVSGEFLFNEVTSFLLIKNSTTPMPFLQSDLYSVPQPALFLLDSCFGLWLWQGWWEENSESERGSGHVRFQAERRAAMLTAMAYWNLKYKSSAPEAFLIWAGLEPLAFTNQFPFWIDRDDIAEINMKDGRKPGEMVSISAELASVTQSTYPLVQLQNRPLPEGVNPSSLENYLEPQCFQKVFAMEKEEFLKLPSWKKKKLKQDVGLF